MPSHRDCYFDGFWQGMRPLGARPHWGEWMTHGADEIRAAFPLAARFTALRVELDPAGSSRTPSWTASSGRELGHSKPMGQSE